MSLPIGARALIRRRFDPDAFDARGRLQPRTYTDAPFTGAIQPLAGDDREVLPEGVRSTSSHVVYTRIPHTLLTAEPQTQTAADRVVDGATVYVVTHVDTWDVSELIPHDRAYLSQLQERDAP